MKRSIWPTFAIMGAMLATGVNVRAESPQRPGETPTVTSAQANMATSPSFQFQEPAPVVEGEAVRKSQTQQSTRQALPAPSSKPEGGTPAAIAVTAPSASQQTVLARHDQPQAAPARRGLQLEPVQASPQLLEASRQVSGAGLEIANLGKSMMSARPKKDGEATGDENLPALSNYYGDVTVNYYVSPEGQQRKVGKVNHQEEVEGLLSAEPPIHYAPACTTCGVPNCCPNRACHCLGVFAQTMYIRPGNADIVYATEQLGCDPGLATPTGPQGLIAPDAELGFRAGVIVPITECSSFIASYTWFQSDTNSHIDAADGAVLAFDAAHPSLANCGTNSISASAKFDLDFELVDLAYHRELWGACNWAINYTAGVRYGRLEQEFVARQDIGSASGLATVYTDIDFDGLGVRFGLDGQRISAKTGLFIYASGGASFLGGNYRADYVQVNQFGAGTNIAVSREDYRVTTILEAELGVGWQSRKGHLRITAGYMAMGWQNVLLANAYLNEVTAGLPAETDDFLTFDGLVSGFELRF